MAKKKIKIDRNRILSLSSDPNLTQSSGPQVFNTLMDSSGNTYKNMEKSKTGTPKEVTQSNRANTVIQPGDPKVVYDELTTGQTGILYGIPQAPLVMLTDPTITNLFKREYTTYDEYRKIRKDPTVSLCRAVIVGAILSGAWTVKSNDKTDPVWIKFIQDEVQTLRFHLMEKALYGCIDFGWQGFEKVFEVKEVNVGDEEKPKLEKLISIRKVKPLLQDMTSIMVYIYNGDFSGFRQGIVFIEAPQKALLCNIRVEGTMWHGLSLLEDVKDSVDKWNLVEEGAQRYDRKIAGSHWVVYFPLGSSKINGVDTDNGTIAANILQSLESSGSIALPVQLLNFVGGMENTEDNQSWKVELISDTGARQSSFVERARYLDSCKARGMHCPERAIMEGQFGTKAEAEGHADIMTVLLENIDYSMTHAFNVQLVDHLLELNWGKKAVGKVWLESSPISDDKIAHIRNLFGSLLGNPSGFMEVFPYVDYEQMMEMCEIPKNKEVIKKTPEEQSIPGANPEQLQQMNQSGIKPGNPQPLQNILPLLQGLVNKGKQTSNLKGNLPTKDLGKESSPSIKEGEGKEPLDIPTELENVKEVDKKGVGEEVKDKAKPESKEEVKSSKEAKPKKKATPTKEVEKKE